MALQRRLQIQLELFVDLAGNAGSGSGSGDAQLVFQVQELQVRWRRWRFRDGGVAFGYVRYGVSNVFFYISKNHHPKEPVN